jgi:hypothetical protein
MMEERETQGRRASVCPQRLHTGHRKQMKNRHAIEGVRRGYEENGR